MATTYFNLNINSEDQALHNFCFRLNDIAHVKHALPEKRKHEKEPVRIYDFDIGPRCSE